MNIINAACAWVATFFASPEPQLPLQTLRICDEANHRLNEEAGPDSIAVEPLSDEFLADPGDL